MSIAAAEQTRIIRYRLLPADPPGGIGERWQAWPDGREYLAVICTSYNEAVGQCVIVCAEWLGIEVLGEFTPPGGGSRTS